VTPLRLSVPRKSPLGSEKSGLTHHGECFVGSL
jgi:hypothetical protein